MSDSRHDQHDELLIRLGALAREQDEAAERDPRAEALLAPLDGEFRDSLARKLGAAEARSTGKSNVVPLRRGRVATVVVALAAAAALVFFVSTRSTEPALPEYAMTATGGDQEVRSTHAPKPSEIKLSTGGRLQVVLRPAQPTKLAEARAFLVRDGVATPWAVPLETSDEGSIRLAGETSKLFPNGAGRWGVLLIVGRAAKVSVEPATAAKMFATGTGDGVQVHRLEVTVTP